MDSENINGQEYYNTVVKKTKIPHKLAYKHKNNGTPSRMFQNALICSYAKYALVQAQFHG